MVGRVLRKVCCLVYDDCYMLCVVCCVRCRLWCVVNWLLLCGCVLVAV